MTTFQKASVAAVVAIGVVGFAVAVAIISFMPSKGTGIRALPIEYALEGAVNAASDVIDGELFCIVGWQRSETLNTVSYRPDSGEVLVRAPEQQPMRLMSDQLPGLLILSWSESYREPGYYRFVQGALSVELDADCHFE